MNGRAPGPALGVAAAVVAVTCCAGLPTIGALLGGITLASVLGVGGGVLVLVALGGGTLLLARARRRRRSCQTTAHRPIA